jgi:hypothetical protein
LVFRLSDFKSSHQSATNPLRDGQLAILRCLLYPFPVFWAEASDEAGADAIAAQGMEAGGHRGMFNADDAERQMVGSIALVPQIADALRFP